MLLGHRRCLDKRGYINNGLSIKRITQTTPGAQSPTETRGQRLRASVYRCSVTWPGRSPLHRGPHTSNGRGGGGGSEPWRRRGGAGMRWKRRGLNVRDRGWLGMGQKGVDTTILEQLLSVTNIAGEGLWAKGDRRCCVAGLVHGIGGSRPRALSNASPPAFFVGGGGSEKGGSQVRAQKRPQQNLVPKGPNVGWRHNGLGTGVCASALKLFSWGSVYTHAHAHRVAGTPACPPPPPKDPTARAKKARGQYYL